MITKNSKVKIADNHPDIKIRGRKGIVTDTYKNGADCRVKLFADASAALAGRYEFRFVGAQHLKEVVA